jgi:hypothetical protein
MFDLPHLLEPRWFSILREKNVIGSFILIGGIGIAIAVISSIGIINLFRYTDVLKHMDILKASIEITLVLYVSLFLVAQLVEYLLESFLTDLERRIIVDNLSPEEIRETMVNEFLGPTLSEWLYRMETILSMKYNSITSELSNIDKKCKHKIAGRKKGIYDAAKKAYNEYADLSKNNLQKLQYLYEKGPLSESAKKIFAEVVGKIKEQGKEVERLYKKRKIGGGP